MSRRLQVYKSQSQSVGSGGAVCSCCGEDIIEFLTIDHIDGGGNQHRKEVGNSGGPFCFWLKRQGYPPGYQVLCFNCNVGRYINGGVYPHKTKVINAST